MSEDGPAGGTDYWGHLPPPPTRATRQVSGGANTVPAPGYWGSAPPTDVTDQQPGGPAWSAAPSSWAPQPRATLPPAAASARPRRASGLLTISIGGLLVLLSITTLDWAGDGLEAKDFTFFHSASSEPGPGLTQVYFGWLAYVLLAVCLVAAYLIKFTALGGLVARAAVALACVVAAALSFGSLWSGNSLHDVVTYGDAGFWCAVVGYLVIAVGTLAPA